MGNGIRFLIFAIPCGALLAMVNLGLQQLAPGWWGLLIAKSLFARVIETGQRRDR
jgi:hypothetical protein